MPEQKLDVPACPRRASGHLWRFDRERSTRDCQAEVCPACGAGAVDVVPDGAGGALCGFGSGGRRVSGDPAKGIERRCPVAGSDKRRSVNPRRASVFEGFSVSAPTTAPCGCGFTTADGRSVRSLTLPLSEQLPLELGQVPRRCRTRGGRPRWVVSIWSCMSLSRPARVPKPLTPFAGNANTAYRDGAGLLGGENHRALQTPAAKRPTPTVG